jgi:hypothetical protein
MMMLIGQQATVSAPTAPHGRWGYWTHSACQYATQAMMEIAFICSKRIGFGSNTESTGDGIRIMKRIKKALLLPVRNMAYSRKHLRLFYWADVRLYELRTVCVMPRWYYCWLYHASMNLIKTGKLMRLADRMIHTIPYQVRHEMA